MQKRLLRWELIGFAFTGAVGTLLHFVYEWTGGNPLIAAFCAVNESTWEHMKLRLSLENIAILQEDEVILVVFSQIIDGSW